MKRFLQFSAAVMCLAVAVAALSVASSVSSFTHSVLVLIDKRAAEIQVQTFELAEGLRADLDKLAGDLRKDTFKRADRAQADVIDRVDSSTILFDARIAEITRTIDARLADASNKIDGRLGETNAQLVNVTSRWLEREPLVYSRFLATTGELNRTLDATRRASEAFAEEAPQISHSIVKIADDVSQVTGYAAGFTKPKPFWRRAVDTMIGVAPFVLTH